jgi:hypothetical protein
MTDTLPKPPIDAAVDLRDFRFMPLDVVKLWNSDTWAMADGWEAKACINLWCRAWHQVPAGSLPNNENLLRTWSGVPDWDGVREVALRGFEKCRDGRLYHAVIVEEVCKAWERKQEAAAAKETDRQRKKEWRERKRKRKQRPRPAGQDGDGTPDETGTGQGKDADVRSMTGTGTGTIEESPPDRSSTPAREPSPGEMAGGGFSENAKATLETFLKLRNRFWPNNPNLPAPHMSIASEAEEWLDRGMLPDAIGQVLEVQMLKAAEKGKSAPHSLKAYGLSLGDALGTGGKANGGTASWEDRPDESSEVQAAIDEWEACADSEKRSELKQRILDLKAAEEARGKAAPDPGGERPEYLDRRKESA